MSNREALRTGAAALADAFAQAAAAYRAGMFGPAAALCVAIADRRPGHFDTLHLLARAQFRLGRLSEAVASYDRALAVDPRHFEALYNRAVVLQRLKRLEEALAGYDRALAIKPDFPAALANRGVTLRDLRRFDQALESYDRALAIAAGDAGVLYNRGNVLRDLRRHEEALASYDRALDLDPGHADAHNNRAVALRDLRRSEQALASSERALRLRPDRAEAHFNRGLALSDLRRFDEALASYDRALALEPDHAETLYNRGVVLRKLGRLEASIADFERVLTLDPAFKPLEGLLLHTRMQCCDWHAFGDDVERLLCKVRAGTCASGPFALLGLAATAGDQLACARTWVRDRYPASPTPVWNGERYRHDRIRIAYLSADFHDHPMAYLMAGVFERHDRARFETFAVSSGPDSPGGTRMRLKAAFDCFVDVRCETDADVARRLRELEIDIAVDLMGHTLDARTQIFALRPAPVQVSYLGYPGTTGADYIDYVLADRFVIPEPSRKFYSEHVVYLPDTFQANDQTRPIADEGLPRAAAGLPDSGFVFCSFNKSYKITPAMFDVWMGLVRAVEGSVLWLFGSNAAVERNLRREAERRGVAPDRLILAPRVPYAQYLARYRLADLFLDTSPFNGGATASDALWAGLPVITVTGEAFASRMAGSLLHAAGLPELVTDSLADYEAVALKLARDARLLAAIRTRLAYGRATRPLFDADRFCRHLEAAYVTMWRRHQRGEPPAGFAVEPVR